MSNEGGDVAVCTTFNQAGYYLYGRRFLESFLRHWTPLVTLYVFWEDGQPPERGPIYIPLAEDPDLRAFKARHSGKPRAHGIVSTSRGHVIDYRWQVIKFCHKVFAATWPDRPAHIRRWIWLDADVLTKRAVFRPDIDRIVPLTAAVGAYLGRKDWHHSETGYLSWNTEREGGNFLAEYRRWYTEDRVFELPEWHDCIVYDMLRSQWEKAGRGAFVNLSEGVPGMDVWPSTVLGEFMDHHKGPVAKGKVYGTAC